MKTDKKQTKQITVRPSIQEYAAFEDWRQSSEGGVPESTALCNLLRRYFEGGYRREPIHRIEALNAKIDSLQIL